MAVTITLSAMTTGSKKSPALSITEARRFVDRLRGALNDKFDGNQTALAKSLGVSQSAVSQLLSGKNSPSTDTARALGKLMGFDYRSLLDEPSVGVSKAPVFVEKLRPRGEWQGLVDEALEILIREGFSAAESRRALNGAQAFRSDTEITTQDLVRFARALISEERHDSGKHRRSKHV
jgi:transcriptional regulator with XRE-family HTH domain